MRQSNVHVGAIQKIQDALDFGAGIERFDVSNWDINGLSWAQI